MAAAVLVTATTGCSALADDSAEVTVAAAFYPLAYVAERVAGEHAAVESITQPGGEPHDLELTIRETALIAEAELVVHEEGFQPAVDAGIQENAQGEVLDVSDVADLVPLGEDHEEHAEHSDDEGDDHDHEGDLDPHFWVDPLRLADVGDAVADELAALVPEHADDFRANAADLRSDLEELDAAYVEGLADCERALVVVSHDAFAYLGRYGLEFASVAGLSPDAEPTPADLGRLQQLIDETGVTTVFSERLVSTRLTDSLASDLRISTSVLDPLEGLTEETEDGDYLTLARANLVALQEANGCR